MFSASVVRAQVAFGTEEFKMTTLISSDVLSNPYDMFYGPDDWLWVSERWGHRILRIHSQTGALDVLLDGSGQYTRFLGMVLDPQFGTSNKWVYVAATTGNDHRVVRFEYQESNNNGSLINPTTIISGLRIASDHVSGRLVIGNDNKLYLTCGDLFANHSSRQCVENQAQDLPTQSDIDAGDKQLYIGKILRMNMDGSIPADNPVINGVQSHIYTYGHRNPQGLVAAQNGKIYSNEHGPATDDEVNLITAGGNYGWPNVAGYKDDVNYSYCNRSSNPNCGSEPFDVLVCPDGAENTAETAWTGSQVDPLISMFPVPDINDLYNNCSVEFICRPGISPSNLVYYDEGDNGIPGWGTCLLVASLKTGSVYRLQLNESGDAIVGDPIRYFNTVNRYRDIVVAPDNKSFYVLTDQSGSTQTLDGSASTSDKDNPGTIIKFEWKNPALNVAIDTSICKGSSITFGNLFITTSGNYTQEFQSGLGSDSTVVMNVTVNDLPEVDLGADQTVKQGEAVVLNAGAGFDSYLWSTDETAASIYPDTSTPGTFNYSVSVTDQNGCEAQDEITITITPKQETVLEAGMTRSFQVFPNPAQSSFTINATSLKIQNMYLMNLAGQKIKEWNQSKSEYQIADIPSGTYILVINDNILTRLVKR